MACLIIPYILAANVVVFSKTLGLKLLGMFIQGALHVKIMLSYTHMYELVAEQHKIICAVFLNVADAMTLVITGLTYMFIT